MAQKRTTAAEEAELDFKELITGPLDLYRGSPRTCRCGWVVWCLLGGRETRKRVENGLAPQCDDAYNCGF